MQRPIAFGGRQFLLDDQNDTDYVARQMQDGGYEAPLPMMTLAILSRTKGLFCDIGANNGLYTVLACQAAPSVRVAAFEPYPPALATLRSNISINGLCERVEIYDMALSESSGTATLYVPDPGHGLLETSCSLESSFKSEIGRNSIEVARKRFDDMQASLSLISLIKVDIEGHELGFLRGATSTLKRHRPIVFAEMLPASIQNFYEITEIIDSLDYVKFRLRDTMAIYTPTIIVDQRALNYAFVPLEKFSLFETCCLAHNLEIFSEYKP